MAGTAFAKTVEAGEKIAQSVCGMKSAKAAISAAVDEGTEAARRTIKLGRRAAEDLDEDAVRRVRQHPRTTVAVTFGIAMGAGLLLGWLCGRAHK